MLGFRFTGLDRRDIIILLILALLAIACEIVLVFSKDYGTSDSITMFITLAIFWATVTSPLGLRFRNFYFSLIWLIICLIIYFITQNAWTPLLPLIGFVDYQIVRAYYWIDYKKEFIPLVISKSGMKLRFSKLESRKANENDKKYMMFLFIFGMTTMTIYIIASS